MMPRRGQDIMAESFRLIEAEVGRHGFSTREWPIVRRMIHATGDVELASLIRFHNDPVAAALQAFARHADVVTDVTMVLAGIHQPSADKLGIPLRCYLNETGMDEQARALGKTRCACGMEHALARHPNALYVVGNAPTALMALCTGVREGVTKPALIVAMPVGFVAVPQSKEEAMRLPVPIITIVGRKGGSAVAAATVNALMALALEVPSS
jgi:precorrin-8X/cobalt-precorrin-8 methylmutase